MERLERWKAALSRLFPREKRTGLLLLLGLSGVLLIALSSLTGERQAAAQAQAPAEEGPEDYAAALERELSRIGRAITGEEDLAVLVTLESEAESVYARDEKESTREGGGERSSSHVLLKGSGGAQQALTVTRLRPKVRGVVIVSARAGDPVIRERLVSAVRTALDLSAARVCVTEKDAGD